MKKRALVLSVLSAMMLAGCADRGTKDEIIVVSDKKVEDNREETVIEETEQAVALAESVETLEDTEYEHADGDQNWEDIPEELRPVVGKWKLDGYKTNQEMKKLGTDWGYEYGTGGQYGAGAVLMADGYFSYYVAIGIGGEGSYLYEDGLVTATAMPYERETVEQTIELYPKTEDGVEYLVLKMETHEIYLIRED